VEATNFTRAPLSFHAFTAWSTDQRLLRAAL
jgi:hypothetical protein